MCLEDLALGKGRFSGVPAITSGPTGNVKLLDADPRRVAVLITFVASLNGSAVATDLVPDTCLVILPDISNSIPVAVLGGLNSKLLLRIEDFGIAITGQINVQVTDNVGAGNTVVAWPILTYVNVPAYDRNKP